MFPWFILNEIFIYAIQNNRQLCLINKEWFNKNVGQFIILNHRKLNINRKLFDWFKLAEHLSLSDYDNLNWEFLNECSKVKSVELYNFEDFVEDFDKLKEFFWNSKLESVKLTFEGEEELNKSCQLLKGISKQLNKLEITDSFCEIPYDELFALGYPKLKEFIVHKFELLQLNLINRFMPNLEKLEIYLDIDDTFHDSYKFSSLKTLVYHKQEGSSDYSSGSNIMDIFKCHFPNLTSFSSKTILYTGTLDLISQSMPKIEKLDFSIAFNNSSDVKFPNNPLYHLQELNFWSKDNSNMKHSFKLDLVKLPKLLKLNYASELNLINSDEHHHSLLNHLSLTNTSVLPTKIILNQLQNLVLLKVDCTYFGNKFLNVFKFLTRVTKLSLDGIQNIIPIEFLPYGQLKTTHLELKGYAFLTDDFIHWLSNQTQLTHLTIHYYTRVDWNLTPVFFPSLQVLYINGWEEDAAYLRSIILFNVLQTYES